MSGRKKRELVGKRIGKLTVLKLAIATRNQQYYWVCKCDCGVIKSYSTDHLTRKKQPVKSCGCLKKIKGAQHKDWKGFGEISGSWWRLHCARDAVNKVRRKRLPYEITIQYAWKLFLKQNKKCALSGDPIFHSGNPIYNTASLDRIDSSKRYTETNVQWVHKHVNFMKRNYSQEYFIEMCKKVAYNK